MDTQQGKIYWMIYIKGYAQSSNPVPFYIYLINLVNQIRDNIIMHETEDDT